MKFDKIYSCGSSFSCGGGLNWPLVQTLYNEIHNIDLKNEIQYSYPNLISSNYSISIVNQSIAGGSANRLIRKTYQFIHNHQLESKNSLFLLEIPPMWRDEFYSNEFDKTFNITWGVLKDVNDKTQIANGNLDLDTTDIKKFLLEYFDRFINVDFEIKKTMNNLLGLFSYLKLLKINFVIINGFEFYSFLLKNNLDITYNFYWVDNMIEPINISFIKNNLTITHELKENYTDNHLGFFGNQYIANNLIEYINKTI